VDFRGPVLLIFAALVAYYAWRADRSGSVRLKWSLVHRADQPRFFRVVIVAHWVFAVAAALLGVAALLGWEPAPLGLHPDTCRTC
jgi:type VI protein secretion system component VasF